MAETLLRLEHVNTQFETKQGTVRAVNDVSLSVDEGETLGVVGESGCGKSMTALSIMRLVPSGGKTVSGSIHFSDTDLLALPEEEMRHYRGKEIGMIFQEPMTALTPTMTIGRQISETMEVHLDLDRTAARERTVEVLNQVGIPSPEQRYNDYVHQFSGGMRQRVMIAIAFCCHPRLLLADEPTTALDVTVQAQVLQLLRELATGSGLSTILITHDMGIVAGMCDRVAVMYAGRMVETAPVDALFETPLHPYTWGLLRSVPGLDTQRSQRLLSIPGLPPDLANLPPGCNYWPRCPFVQDRCKEQDPAFGSVDDKHGVACWRASEGLLEGKDLP
jgi:oligopeptide/dipeptide ABC transporter ATP-binding protein